MTLSKGLLKKMIGQGKLKDSLDILETILTAKQNSELKYYDDFIILKFQYSDLSRLEMLNLISADKQSISKNKLVRSILEFINSIDESLFNNSNLSPKNNQLKVGEKEVDIRIGAKLRGFNAIKKVLKKIRAATRDSSLYFKYIRKGSLIITCSMSKEGLLNLKDSIRSGHLQNEIKQNDIDLFILNKDVFRSKLEHKKYMDLKIKLIKKNLERQKEKAIKKKTGRPDRLKRAARAKKGKANPTPKRRRRQ